jgi:chromate reductase
MTRPYDVAVFVGSLRKEAFSRKTANALAELGQPGLALSQVEIGKLSFYNQDQDGDPPSDWKALRDRIRKADAVLFVTPEYNRSVPGVLKNAIDIASRPYGQNAFDGKPGAVVSVSPSNIGGFGANHHLRQSLVFLNVPVLQQPEIYVGGADKLFDAAGKLQNAQTRDFLQGFTRAFEAFISRFAAQK